MIASGKTRVLIVDDSALVRQMLSEALGRDPDLEVVGTASDPFVARDKIVKLKPHVLTLDVEMPRMDGIEFLKHLMPQYPMPVVIVSSLTEKGKQTTLDAMAAGALDFVTKPSSQFGGQGLEAIVSELCTKIKIASTIDVSRWKGQRVAKVEKVSESSALAETTDKVVAIGSSTGGTEAVRKIINALPRTFPGIVITQHMPAGFTKSFADSLNRDALMQVKEAETGDRIMPGLVLIAPGAKHMTVHRSGGYYHVTCQEGEKVSGHCPSVDVLFNSVAKSVGSNAVGAILTGMGRDGADGLLAMKEAGAETMAQDEKSCVVFGMPKEAYKCGATKRMVPLDQIPTVLNRLLT